MPPGWATGPNAPDFQGQVNADTTGADNSVLVLSARGSDDVYGGDLAHNKIGAWTQGAGIELIHEGWNVRDLQAVYPGATVWDARPGDPLQFHAVEVKAANGANIVWFLLDKAGGKVTSFELPSPQFCE